MSHKRNEAPSAARPGSVISLTIDDVGVFALTAVPETSLALKLDASKREGAAYLITFKGRAKGFPDQTLCGVSFRASPLAHPTDPWSGELGVVPLTVRGDEGEITLRFDLVTAKVFEPASVAFTVTPQFRLAVPDHVEGALLLEHSLSIACLHEDRARVGEIVRFKPQGDALFDDLHLRLTLFEDDTGEGGSDEGDATRSLHAITWDAHERGPKAWRAGCASLEEGAVLTYPEADEVGAYEVGMRVEVSDDGGHTFVPSMDSRRALTLPRPSLEAFNLRFEPQGLRSALRDEAALARELEVVDHACVRVYGRVAQISATLALPLEIDLWSWAPLPPRVPEFLSACAVKALIDEPIVVHTDARGEFDVVIFTVDAATSTDDLRDLANCFAVLRVSPAATPARGGCLPVHQVLAFSDQRFAPLDDDVLMATRPHGAPPAPLLRLAHSLAESATAVASEELPRGMHVLDTDPSEASMAPRGWRNFEE